MPDPFRIPVPFYVSFSGGRTSGMMLRLILDAYGGRLPGGAKVLFANTGKEREETLRFVNECSRRWDVKIYWLEYRRDPNVPVVKWKGRQTIIGCHSFQVVSFETANRDGTPFRELIEVKAQFRAEAKGQPPVLPNPVQRFCSGDLKQRTMDRFIRGFGWDEHTVAVGLRAEEASRVSRLKGQATSEVDYAFPLYDAGITEKDVLAFWKEQEFDLELPSDPELGTYQGNCDFCFLKRIPKIKRLAREDPAGVSWWADLERRTGQVFRKDRFSYIDLEEGRVPLTVIGKEEMSEDEPTCLCTD